MAARFYNELNNLGTADFFAMMCAGSVFNIKIILLDLEGPTGEVEGISPYGMWIGGLRVRVWPPSQ